MTIPSNPDVSISKEGVMDAAIPPGAMHGPHHSVVDMTEIAAQDEVQHESALRDSSLRIPR